MNSSCLGMGKSAGEREGWNSKGCKEVFGDNRYAHYLCWDDGFTGVYMSDLT